MDFSLFTGLLLFCVIHATQQPSYTVADIDYKVPFCGIPNGQSLTNSIAVATITNNVIGNVVTLNFDFSDPNSCYLCEKNNLTCIDDNISTNVGFGTTRAYDTILVILEPGTNRILAQSGRIRSTLATNSISFDLTRLLGTSQSLCLFQFNFILTTLINIGTSLDTTLTELSRCFIVPKQQQRDSIQCNSNRLYQAAGFNCVIYPTIYPMQYTTTNCLVTIQNSTVNPPIVTNYSPLYWYTQFLTQNNQTNLTPITLCNQPLPVILYKSNLFLSQCYNKGALSAWYQLATLVVAYHMNQNTTPFWQLLRAKDFLERNCDKIDMSPVNTTGSYIMKTIQSLAFIGDDTDEKDILCDSIAFYFKNNTVLKDVSLLNRWYFEAFKYISVPTMETETRAVIILTVVCITPFILLCIIIFYHYKIKIKGIKNPIKNVLTI